MNRDHWEHVTSTSVVGTPEIRADYFDSTPRTLLYGYNTARDTWHVYMDGGRICRTVYSYPAVESPRAVKKEVWDNPQDLIPNKRLYPESCDYQFVLWLERNGFDLTLLPFDDTRYEQVKDLTFHGATDDN